MGNTRQILLTVLCAGSSSGLVKAGSGTGTPSSTWAQEPSPFP